MGDGWEKTDALIAETGRAIEELHRTLQKKSLSEDAGPLWHAIEALVQAHETISVRLAQEIGSLKKRVAQLEARSEE